MTTLLEKASGLVFPRLGSNMNPPIRAVDDFERFKSLLERYPFGGLVLFNGDVDHTPALLAELQHISSRRLLVGSDIERGTGQQIAGATLFPHARAVAEAGLPAVRTMAEITAREAVACGIHITFAPVADVNSNPENPIIGIRAFGTEPRQVSEATQLYVRTCHEHGLFATAKHFPGHGNTATDSHETLPVVDRTRSELDAIDIAPFKTAIEAGSALVMTAHVAYPALDASGLPATQSATILQTLLRNELGFTGPVITDSLIMGAVDTSKERLAAFAAELLNAGIDILLDPPDPPAMVEGIIHAIEQQWVSEHRVEEALDRIDTLRRQIDPSMTDKGPDLNPRTVVGTPEYLDAAVHIAEQAIDLQLAQEKPVFRADDRIICVYVKPYKTHLDPAEEPMGRLIRDAFPQATYIEVEGETPDAELKQLLHSAKESPYRLASVVAKPAAWRAFGLPDHLSRFVSALVKSGPTTLVAMGDQRILAEYPDAEHHVCTYSDVPVSQEALVRYLQRSQA